MDYKQKYENALERCKKEFNFNNLAYSHEEIKQRLERVFPELKESEDERIRRVIIKSINDLNTEWLELHGITKKEALAWLEKQGGQKLAWSEENICYYDDICEILINLINSPKSNVNKDVVQKDLDWLRSVKESQLKPAWSEEDEHCIELLLPIIDSSSLIPKNRKKCKNFLKSLKERMKGEAK